MLGDRRLGESEQLNQLVHGTVADPQGVQDLPTVGFGDDLEQTGGHVPSMLLRQYSCQAIFRRIIAGVPGAGGSSHAGTRAGGGVRRAGAVRRGCRTSSAEQADVTLIDQADGFVFGYSKLDAMFGRTTPEAVHHRYARPGQAGRPLRRRPRQPDRSGADVGSRPTPGTSRRTCSWWPSVPNCDPAATPGSGSRRDRSSTRGRAPSPPREALAAVRGGRVVVGVTATPFKCPPAPSETALLLHDFLVDRGVRDADPVIDL